MLTIGIDSGTQSSKGIVLDVASGEVLAESRHGYELVTGLPEGHLEQRPGDWVEAVQACIEECLHQLGERRHEIRGIGVSGQQHGLVVLDEAGEPLRDAKLWCDTSTVAQCQAFEAEFGGAAGLIALAGNAMLPGYTIPKLLWIKDNEPENFARIRTILLPHDYLNFWLTGTCRMEYGDASGMGILDVRTRQWCRPLIDFVDPSVAEMLPELGSSRAPHGVLRPDLASAWGLSDDVLVSAGGGDNMMGAIGTGNTRPGVVTASFGTSGTLYGCADDPIVDPKGEVAAFCDSTDRWLPLVCTMNVTVVTEKTRALLGMDLGGMEAAVASVPPGAEGLTFLPYLNGERTPNLPGGKGVLHGLNPGNMSPAHLARAAMEGATLGLAYGLGRMRELGMNPTEIRLTGGGSQSPTWRQIAADCFDAEVVCLRSTEAAALGAAIQAAHGAGGGSYDELTGRLVGLDEASRCAPTPDNREVYAGRLQRFRDLTEVLEERGLF
jgi:xylulokinase